MLCFQISNNISHHCLFKFKDGQKTSTMIRKLGKDIETLMETLKTEKKLVFKNLRERWGRLSALRLLSAFLN